MLYSLFVLARRIGGLHALSSHCIDSLSVINGSFDVATNAYKINSSPLPPRNGTANGIGISNAGQFNENKAANQNLPWAT